MKKTAMIVAAIMGCAALSSCGGVGNRTTTSQGNSGTSVLGNVLGAVANGQTIGNVLGSVLGTDKPKESDLLGTWKYRQPGVAFSSENTLAKAGGEAIAAEIKEKLSNTYSKVGFSASNTYLTFNSDKTFTGKLDGKSISGTWTYESSDQKLTLKTLLFSINCYAKKTTGGIAHPAADCRQALGQQYPPDHRQYQPELRWRTHGLRHEKISLPSAHLSTTSLHP